MADAWDQFQDAPTQAGDDPWAQFQDADQPSVPAEPSPAPQQPTGAVADAVLEPLTQLGTSAVATPVAGVAGLATAGARGLGLTNAEPTDVIARIQEALTYQPRTRAGQAVSGAIAYPFEKLAQGADWLGDQVARRSDTPGDAYDMAGAAINTAGQAAPSLLLRGRARPAEVRPNVRSSPPPVDRPVASGEAAPPAGPAAPAQRSPQLARVPEQSVPTRAELSDAASAAYKRADDAGVVVSENSLKGLKARVVSMTKKEGIDKDLHPDATAALKKIVQSKGELTLSELETLRKVAKDAQGSLKPSDKRLASKIVDELDDYMDNLGDADVVAGDATKAKALKEARGLYSRAKKAETIEDLVKRAELSAPNFSASGMENALRTEFRGLAKNKKQMRMFTADEQAAIRRVAQGGKVENALRFVGKFAPTGVVSGLGSTAAAAALGPAGLGVPLAGLAGRYAATRMTMKNVKAADELMRRGPEQANALAKTKAEQKHNALADF